MSAYGIHEEMQGKENRREQKVRSLRASRGRRTSRTFEGRPLRDDGQLGGSLGMRRGGRRRVGSTVGRLVAWEGVHVTVRGVGAVAYPLFFIPAGMAFYWF